MFYASPIYTNLLILFLRKNNKGERERGKKGRRAERVKEKSN